MEVFVGWPSHHLRIFVLNSTYYLQEVVYTHKQIRGGADPNIMSEPMSESGYVNCSMVWWDSPHFQTSKLGPSWTFSFPPQKSGATSVEELKRFSSNCTPGKMDGNTTSEREVATGEFCIHFWDVHIFWISWILNVKFWDNVNWDPTPCAREDYLKKEDYGKVPKYLQSIKQANSP